MNVVRRVRAEVAHAVPASARVLVACSGGPDSMVLLDALASTHVSVAVAAVDHGLRREAAAEAEAVRAYAVKRGLSAAALTIAVPRPTMAAARDARYAALVAHAGAVGADTIAVGHTATDQAETLLDRMIRGAGARGLAGMPRRRLLRPGLWLVRPLLSVTRDEIEGYVTRVGLPVVRDPTNADLAYRRSRLRHEVLPLLRRERPDLDRALAQLCDRLRADADALDAQAEAQAAALARPDGLDARGLLALPDALIARVVARAAGVPLESVHVRAIRRLCDGFAGTRGIDLPGGACCERRYDRLRFGPRAVDPGDVEVAVTGPGRYPFFDRMVDISDDGWQTLQPGPIVLRNFRHGDRAGGEKLKTRFINLKIPRPERRQVPLLVRRGEARDEILWVPGVLRPAHALTEPARVQ